MLRRSRWPLAAALSLALMAPASAQIIRASYYASGTRCADGTAFHAGSNVIAHRTLPFGTRVRVCYHGCATGVVHDRGPLVRGRQMDLARGLAASIGMVGSGVASIEATVIGGAGRPFSVRQRKRRHCRLHQRRHRRV